MILTQKSREIIDSCRFCWMCRHICPIGNATGQERNNARARALALSMVDRGSEQLKNVIDNIYECALCGACTKECVTGWDPVKFTKEVRLQAALDGCLPDYINQLLDNLESTGNIYGQTEIDKELLSEIDSLPKQSDTLLFLGRDAIFKSSASAVNAIRLLKAAKVDFTVLPQEPDSGYMMDALAGAAEETRQMMMDTAKQLDYQTIIAYDPCDAKTFLREYQEWDIKLSANVVTFTAYLADLAESGRLKLQKSKKSYTFQDPAHLARDLEETQAARTILAACGQIKEMLLHGKDTMWAGSCMMYQYMPDVMRKTASNRWLNAENAGAKVLVTACPGEYEILKLAKPEQIDIMTIEEVVLSCLLD